ncbi:hypothetical protein [Streptomyces sp. NBC_01373]|uniref:hypothetical protein n=1 Tax=Streptomyces sp. NBC_01373 TaxID=2903843 RepID=UPI002256A02E|nr:hypothetical protein [Streptomyces sp. NBC_01373]MCX4704351.1 hypothetical protein [Streptomyces sp. NBC_01373]MCX4707091.1 hypothetical protein [Streptomyces sp. NBC_01373]
MMARRPDRNEELAGLIQGEQTDAVRDLEDAIAVRALSDVADGFDALQRRSLTVWVAAFGSVQGEPSDAVLLRRILGTIRAAVRRLLGPLAPRAQRALDARLTDAVELGARQHAAYATQASGRRTRAFPARPSQALRATAARIADTVTDRRDRALALLQPRVANRWTRVATGIGTARSALSAARGHIAWTVGQAVNEGLLAGIRTIGASKLWVSERDACVSCAAYAGLIAEVGDDFPGGLSWDPRQRGRTEPLATPPLHPNCRCRVVAWKDSWAVEGAPSLPEALRREARRSIARGWSLPTESGAARIRAARELLRAGAGLPKSVEEFAALSVRAGRFQDRTVPTGP